MGLLGARGATNNVTVSTSNLEARVGEVQASPTQYTLLDRLKTLATSLASLLTSLNQTIPALNAAVISPHNTNDLANPTRAIWVGTGGDLKVDMVGDGTGITLTNIPDGSQLNIQVSRVYATGTSAADLVAWY